MPFQKFYVNVCTFELSDQNDAVLYYADWFICCALRVPDRKQVCVFVIFLYLVDLKYFLLPLRHRLDPLLWHHCGDAVDECWLESHVSCQCWCFLCLITYCSIMSISQSWVAEDIDIHAVLQCKLYCNEPLLVVVVVYADTYWWH